MIFTLFQKITVTLTKELEAHARDRVRGPLCATTATAVTEVALAPVIFRKSTDEAPERKDELTNVELKT